ncbi:MAG: cell division protein FtsW, partial [Solirubrobacterales bacterium]|nr:cell division protein FtsW [Solirubrobacterales bacterium]
AKATPRPRRRPVERPIEHRLLLTATLCLLAFGAVMVYSASSARNLLQGQGDGTQYFLRYLMGAGVGLVAMSVVQRMSLETLRRMTPLLLAVAFFGLIAVLGVGIRVNGARRWLGASSLEFQPSELMKLALILYAAGFLSAHPRRMRTFKGVLSPVLVVTGAAAFLVAVEPDLGTALVIGFSILALMIAAGVPMRYIGYVVAIAFGLVVLSALVQAHQRARLTSFLHPWAQAGTSGFQAVQGQIALGSGGLFGVGLGQSVQKIFYLPEAHTDFILAVIGEELGVLGILGVLALYGMIAWAGLRTARTAATSYAKLLAAGLTSLILCQATLNIFVVLGLAPLTGVPLPFISYGPSNLVILLCGVGLLLNIAADGGARLRPVPDPPRRRRQR